MIDVVFYFQVHQPYRLRKLKPGDRLTNGNYFDDPLNKMVVERVACPVTVSSTAASSSSGVFAANMPARPRVPDQQR